MKKKIIAFIMAALTFSTLAMGGCAEIGEKIGGGIDSIIEDVTGDTGNVDDEIAFTRTMLSEEGATLYDVNEDDVANTQVLTIYVSPKVGIDTSVNIVTSWVNASSDWATNKDVSEYLTVEKQSEENGTTIALLTCHQAFGEQIRVTVSSNANAAATKDCFVDYSRKFFNPYFSLYKEGSLGVLNTDLSFTDETTCYWKYTSGTGYDAALQVKGTRDTSYTLDDTFTASITFTRTDEYTALLRQQSGVNPSLPAFSETFEFEYSAMQTKDTAGVVLGGEYFPAMGLIDNTSSLPDAVLQGTMSSCLNALQELGNQPFMKVSVKVTCGRGFTCEKEISVFANLSSLAELDIDSTSFIF